MLNVKGVDYRCFLWNMTKNDAIDRLNNSKLDDKGTLGIWICVQIKTSVEVIKEGALNNLWLFNLMVNGIESHGKFLIS